MKRGLLLLVAGMLFFTSYAQERVISGKITSSEDGSALPGVNILVKGTTTGTVTDVNGNYTINAGPNATLVFTFIGFTSIEVETGSRSTVDVQLESDVKQLSEVVVVGYGTQVKQDLTGNIASVSGKEIQNQPVPSFDQAMQGRAAGVFVESGNGKLGQGIKVRVRGAASVSASNEPLYVVDGIIVTTDNLSSTDAPTNPLANINSNDIESIQILKDASAAAIYGSRAANGVVIITTKRGKAGKTAFNLNYMKGFSSPTRKAKWLDGPQYYEAFKEAFDNTDAILQRDEGEDFGSYMYGEPGFTFDQVLSSELGEWNKNANENWADNAYQDDAGIDQMDLSASGGNDKTQFYTSLQFSDQKGILINDRFKKLSARANIDHKASDKISFGLNFSLSRSVNNRLSDDNEFTTPMQLLALPPVQPARLEDGTLNQNTVYFNGLLKAENSTFETTVLRNVSNIYAAWQITPDLSFRSEAGVDLLTQNEDMWNGSEVDSQTGNVKGGGFSAYANIVNYSTNNYLSYNKVFGKHNLDLTAGMSFQKYELDATDITAQTLPSSAFRTLTSASVITDGKSSATDYAFLSYFGRANYKFNDKYLVSLSGRLDGSSKFGKNERYGFFPAASAGWIISQESFMENIKNTLSFLKLRGSIGVTGNAPTQNFAALGLYAANTYDIDPGIAPSQLSNSNLKWETTVQTDFGIDFGLFNDRITGEIDYYVKNTTDVLLNSNVSGISGFLTRFINIGEIENKGFEFVLNSQNIVGEFSWSSSFNFARNRNKIVDLNGNVIEGGYLNRAVEGQPIGVFYGIEYAGVDPQNGDALYYINDPENPSRETTNDYNAASRTIIGNPNPDFIGGLSNTLSYKGFELNFLFQFVYGNDVFNGAGRFQRANFTYFDNQLVEDWENSWREPGDQTDVPEARLFLSNGDKESSRFLQDASYIRLKTLSFGYNFPSTITNRLSMQSLRLYVAAQNLLTITGYDLNDPEVNTDYLAGNIGQGNDFYAAPQIKTISFGVNIGF
ncbi:SusC/RagA family TonB-linked outer membrane protein [Ohtaekwangia koreensis]|uniref:TonB-linked outer membrane protein, SusC/RagA family n=1 Tax=Ohtaekwangia koreensis TaxID=688867 RepID=A0A1T5LRK6_9BACT|nr:TonB-dependent receptor [Ohtaekwangia koreensis]SKC78505.1 TonB-linked outer membrane protein, SusC/RagA family [Ohtaekwangia koreensis]